MMQRVRGLLANRDALSFVAIVVFVVIGYLRGPLWMAFVGGALFGVPSMVELVLLKGKHPHVPTSWTIISRFYLAAILNGLCAAVAGYFMGYGWRAYFYS